jgi:hypothetical protein
MQQLANDLITQSLNHLITRYPFPIYDSRFTQSLNWIAGLALYGRAVNFPRNNKPELIEAGG